MAAAERWRGVRDDFLRGSPRFSAASERLAEFSAATSRNRREQKKILRGKETGVLRGSPRLVSRKGDLKVSIVLKTLFLFDSASMRRLAQTSACYIYEYANMYYLSLTCAYMHTWFTNTHIYIYRILAASLPANSVTCPFGAPWRSLKRLFAELATTCTCLLKVEHTARHFSAVPALQPSDSCGITSVKSMV